ncbi:unnamed protein product [Rotaria magnacalcarata]|uniref:Uncharacterized protein n=1 Tax=Rotaria magnacalcarata TaxID=392030 RepID=A0A819Y9X8_9BILA|nr:unnamed protein product [Rotaria magnacalcarata]CAF4146500.1 unnamed protein product [Rotaria magnacalcarata]CAF4350707.1 unnamed protein product [Rotaria magnacalcarata]
MFTGEINIISQPGEKILAWPGLDQAGYIDWANQASLVDKNQIAYATDLLCETTPIYEYEDKERENIPAPSRSKRKGQTKRSQQKSTTVI